MDDSLDLDEGEEDDDDEEEEAEDEEVQGIASSANSRTCTPIVDFVGKFSPCSTFIPDYTTICFWSASATADFFT